MIELPVPEPPSPRDEVIEILAEGLWELVIRGRRPDKRKIQEFDNCASVNYALLRSTLCYQGETKAMVQGGTSKHWLKKQPLRGKRRSSLGGRPTCQPIRKS